MSRFVKPECNILPITRGETLTVKRRLNRGEQADMFARMRAPDGSMDRVRVGLERVLAYLLEWTVVDDAGVLVPFGELDRDGRANTLNSLDPDDFAEIRNAIEAHIEAVDAARAAEKKTRPGALGSSPTSPSPAGVTGASSGSPTLTPTSTTSSLTSTTASTPTSN